MTDQKMRLLAHRCAYSKESVEYAFKYSYAQILPEFIKCHSQEMSEASDASTH